MMARTLSWRGALPLLVALSLGILAACAGEEATPTPTATATLAPGQTPTAATPTPTATQPPTPTGRPIYGGILRLAMENDAPAFDPVWEGSVTRGYVSWPMHARLWAADPYDPTQVINYLVESYEYLGDGSQMRVTLKSGITWHDGTPFTSEDVQWTRDEQSKNPPPGRSKDLVLGAVYDYTEIIDDLNLIFHLKRPQLQFPLMTPIYSGHIGPKHLKANPDGTSREIGQVDTPEDNVGLGAFKFVSYDRGSVFKTERNDDFNIMTSVDGDQLPYLDGMWTYIIPDASTRFAAFRNGAVEVTQDNFRPITFSQARVIETQMQGEATVGFGDGATNAFLSFNHLRTPYDDVRVRRAIFLTIDRDDVCEILAEGHCVYATHLSPFAPARFGDALADLPGYRKPKTEDIAEANRLLDDYGLPRGSDGIRYSQEMLVRPTSRYQDLALVLQDQMKAIGIDLRLNPMELVAADRRRSARDFDVIPITGVYNGGMGPLANDGYWAAGNNWNYEDTVRDQYQAAAESATDPATFAAQIRLLEDRMLEQVGGFTPTVWLDYPLGVWNQVHDYNLHSNRFDLAVTPIITWKDPGT